MSTHQPQSSRDHLHRRLTADADTWRSAMPSPVRLINPAIATDPAADDQPPAPLPMRRSVSPRTWALATAAVLLVGLTLIWTQNDTTPTTPPTESISTAYLEAGFSQMIALGIDNLDQPLRNETQNLKNNARQTMNFLLSRVSNELVDSSQSDTE